jgi:hypothetical protein
MDKKLLTDRKQRVVIESAHSKWRTIKAGVPQGSILGPLFFIIFINDIVTEIHSFIKLFGDDTSLYVIIDNPRESAITLNNDMCIPIFSNLLSKPLCQTLSKALLMSQKTTRISFPSSKAFPNSSARLRSWLIAESPSVNL